jgi:hypothetical protein
VDEDGMARLTRLAAPPRPPAASAAPPSMTALPSAPLAASLPLPAPVPAPAEAGLPLLDVIVSGEGRMWSGGRYCESAAGGRFRYAGYRDGRYLGGSGSSWHELRVDLADPVTGLRAPGSACPTSAASR